MKKDLKHLPEFYKGYVDLVPEEDLVQALIKNGKKQGEFLQNINEQKGDFKYAEGKWTVKQVISHITDTERIMAYRALRFARNDKTPLPGFDETHYGENSKADNRTIQQLSDEFMHLRVSTVDLFEGFTKEFYKNYGDANGNDISVEALGFVIAGHCIHHINILKERYLIS